MQKPIVFLLFSFVCLAALAQSKTGGASHIVVKGETLYSLSKKYHVTPDAITKANQKNGQDFKLKIGQKIVLPGISMGQDKTAAIATTQERTTKGIPHVAPNKMAKPQAGAVKAATKPVATVSSNSSASSTTHLVVKGETVYGIAKANGVTWRQIKDANHLADDMKLKLGQKLIIPSVDPQATYQPQAKKTVGEAKTVSKPTTIAPAQQIKEYPTSPPPIAKKEMPKEEKIAPLHATEPTPVFKPVVVEQKPIVPEQKPVAAEQKPVKPTPAEPVKIPTQQAKEDENPFARPGKPVPVEAIKNDNANPDDYAASYNKYPASGKKKMVYRGICTFMLSDNPGNQYLALYNYGEMGSVLKVTNLMSKEFIYVKVIGKVPAADGQNDVILKVSSDAAKKLKVSEDKFLVEVTGYNAQ